MPTPREYLEQVYEIKSSCEIPSEFASREQAQHLKIDVLAAKEQLTQLAHQLTKEIGSTRGNVAKKEANAASVERGIFGGLVFSWIGDYFRREAQKEIKKEGARELAPYKKVEMLMYETMGQYNQALARIDQYLDKNG